MKFIRVREGSFEVRRLIEIGSICAQTLNPQP